MLYLRTLFVFLTVAVIGCGPGAPAPKGAVPSGNTVKNVLEQLAKGSDASSTTLMGMRMGMDELKKTDPAKAQAIDQDVAEILKLAQSKANAKAVQAKAQAALQKLEPQK
jgi:hypothetical protein